MIRWKEKAIALFLMGLIFIVSACNNEDGTSNNENMSNMDNEISKGQENVTEVIKNDEEGDVQVDNELEVEINEAPSDQGEFNVWFEGEIDIDQKNVLVRGRTNILPESALQLIVSAEEGALIGSSDLVIVDDDGSFELETAVADKYDGIVHIEISFKPEDQVEEIRNHYVNQLTGSFVRLYTDLGETYQKASFIQTVYLDEGVQSLSITEPDWEVPDDYGESDVWVDPEVTEDDEFITVKLKSNLLEGTWINARASIPNYITSGFIGNGYVNPDGTVELFIKNPINDDRIKNVTQYEIIITVDPGEANNGPHVKEAYGENGENLTGEHVEEEDDRQIVRLQEEVKVK